MSRPLVLIDLDDTLFQTEGKCPAGERDHLVLCAEAGNGRHSYATRPQAGLFAWLSSSAEMVPVTARGSEAFSRVSLDFRDGAVLANGAVILLPGGGVDTEWRDRVAAGLAEALPELERILLDGNASATLFGLDLRSWLVTEEGTPAYAVFKDNRDTGGAGLEVIEDVLPAPKGWTLHRNGNNMAYIPPCISKRLACERLIANARAADPSRPVIGFGDSLSDLAFMGLCDFMATPSRGQVADLLLSRDADADGAHAAPARLSA